MAEEGDKLKEILRTLQKRRDVMVGVAIVSILGVMIIPLPGVILDILISLSIALAIVILVTGVFIRKPLDFSVFPSILLITTLFRLALNIAATRLILMHGNEGIDSAGQVIKAFGSFVVGGNYAVGLIVFLILVTINFVVITKGSGRIAEVAARFTLDGMPGKQMAIDADLNAGLIDEAEARRRRQVISQEADFYGAMDGASKFVRGDAIAGLVIMAINIIGGFIIGTLQQGMPFAEAAKTYTLLTIGEGLVAQIPALLISTAAGIVVSRAGTETDLGRDISQQIFVNPKALGTTSGILIVLALVPGLPHLPFFLMSAAMGALAYAFSRPKGQGDDEQPVMKEAQEPSLETFVEIEPLTFEIGYGLIPLVESESSDLLNKIKAIRRQIAADIGFIVPAIHVKDNIQLRSQEYCFYIRGIEVGRGEVLLDHFLAVTSGASAGLDGIPTKEPAFGLPALWIKKSDIEKAQVLGFTVVDAPTVIATHLVEMLKAHAWELLTRNEVQGLLNALSKNYPKLVDELIPSLMTLGGVQRIIQMLLKERVPINDLVTILETLLDYAPTVKDVEVLTEYVRQALSRYITKQYLSPDGTMYVMTLDPQFEVALAQTVEGGGVISPDVINRLVVAVEKVMRDEKFKGTQPVILCSMNVRRFVRKITERFMPSLVILSSAEIAPSIKLRTMGVVRYEN